VANKKRGDRQGANVQIGIGLSSEGMIRDVEMAMLRLGIVGTVNTRTSSYTGSERRFRSWVWSVTRLEDLERFRALVGILGKDDAVHRAVESKASFRGRPSKWMRTNAPAGYRWEQVSKIEELGEQPTVCISVPGKHAYVTTFVEHNSFCAGRLVGWWLDIHRPGEAFAVTTAPTDKQVKAILWREIGRAHRKGNLAGEVLQTAEWKIGSELVAYGRKPADHDEHAFQGIHARYVLVVIDEACGVAGQLWTASSTLLTNEDARILAIGNPDDPMSEFAQVCDGADPLAGGMSARGWRVLPISAFATPNFTREAVPDGLRRDLTSRLWAEEFARDVGGVALVESHRALLALLDGGVHLAVGLDRLPEDQREVIDTSPLYVSKVLGMFPSDTADGVAPWSWLKGCTLTPQPLTGPVELGIDVGGSDSGDETVIYERVGMSVGRRWSIRSSDPEKVLAKCLEAIDEARPASVKIDSIGIGWGIMGSIRASRPGVHVEAVNVASAATEPKRYLNLRAQIWFEVARGLSKDQGWDLSGLGEESTLAELAAPRWWEDRSGRIVVESKDDIRKRLGRSTDNADALLLAFYHAGEPMQWRSPADMRLPGARMGR
jgi:hypothetical protein